MLLETPYKENDIVSIKLSTGDEVVGKLLSEDDNQIVLSKPLALTATQQGMGLVPFMFTVDQESKFPFNKQLVLIIMKTEQEMSSNYIQNTTGLSIVK
jgi:hypothetical protein